MQSTRTRAERVLQAVKGALFGGKSPASSLGHETENATTKPVSSSVHSQAGFQAVHDQKRSKETSELDRRPWYLCLVNPTVKFGGTYNNEYHANYWSDTGVLSLSVNGTDHMVIDAVEAISLVKILEDFIELEEAE